MPYSLVFNSLRVNERLFLVYILGFLLLYGSFRETPAPSGRASKARSFTLNQSEKIKSSFKNRSMAYLLSAFVSGDKRRLFPVVKKKFKRLGLSHLFTPSGVHLASLYFLLIPILNRLNNKLFLLIPLMSLAYFLTPFHSIKRILLIKTTREWLKKPSLFLIFLISFIWDFLIGTYQLSPLSFSYSFLFLGIILSYCDRPKLFLPLALYGGQIIAQYLSPFPLTTTGFFWNFALTSIFGLFYPIFFITYWFPSIPFGETSINLFYSMVSNSNEIAMALGTVMPTLNMVILCLYFSIGGRKTVIIGLLLIFTSTPLFNIPINAVKKTSSKGRSYLEIERTRSGFTTWHTDRVCRHRHNLTGMNIKCRYE